MAWRNPATGSSQGPDYDPGTLPIGVLGRPHGVRGEVTLRPFNPATDLGGVSRVYLDRGSTTDTLRVLHARAAPHVWVLTLAGVDSREAATALTHARVRVDRAELPGPGPGEFFVDDVLGCQVETSTGNPLGVVREVFSNGAQDVMVVAGAREILIPMVPAHLLAVDFTARRVTVDWEEDD